MSLEGNLDPKKCLLLSPQERRRVGTHQPGDMALPSGAHALLLSVPLTQASPQPSSPSPEEWCWALSSAFQLRNPLESSFTLLTL